MGILRVLFPTLYPLSILHVYPEAQEAWQHQQIKCFEYFPSINNYSDSAGKR